MRKPVEEDQSSDEKEQHCDCGQDVGYVVGFSGLHSANRLSGCSFSLKRACRDKLLANRLSSRLRPLDHVEDRLRVKGLAALIAKAGGGKFLSDAAQAQALARLGAGPMQALGELHSVGVGFAVRLAPLALTVELRHARERKRERD